MLKTLPVLLLTLGLGLSTTAQSGGVGNDAPNQTDDPGQDEDGGTRANDTYVVQAIHLADLSENSVAAISFNKNVAPDKHSEAYVILGNNGRIETVLGYLAGGLNVDLNLNHIQDADLLAKRDELKNLIDAFANSMPDNADANFDAALSAAESLRSGLKDFVTTHDVSNAVRDFVQSQI